MLPPIALSSPIADKIAWAREVFDRYGNRLLAAATVSTQLRDLKSAALAATAEMTRSGVCDICRVCDEEEGGSCCGAGLENHYDGWLLLINRLLGATLPTMRRHENACLFLGESGCLLAARHVICINYLCRKITTRIPSARLERLRDLEGDEITALFGLKETIKTRLKRWNTASGKVSVP